MSATDILRLQSVHTVTLHHTTTKHNADVVHTLPEHSSSSTYSLLAVGNYELHVATGSKVGGISLCEVDGAAGTLIQRSYHASSAVFDLQWRDGLVAGKSLLACADAAGVVSVLELATQGGGAALISLATADVYGGGVSGSGASCLSVDWDDGSVATASSAHSGPSSISVAASSSSGHVSVLTLQQSSSSLSLLASCTAHSLEVWSCAFSPHCPTSLYSGGDDCLLCHVDTRTMQQPTVLSRQHTAGVCCVLPSASGEHVLATGCYDERVRLWDARAMRQPLGERRLNGGVWRLRWGKKDDGSEDDSRLLCCCMHAGVQLLELAEGGAALRVTSEYYEHQSLAYGADWVTVHSSAASGSDERNNAIVSCSFYDNSLRLWQPVNMQAAEAGDSRETVPMIPVCEEPFHKDT